MKLSVIVSPYTGPDEAAVVRHIRYARGCVRDALMRGEAPYASHLLYTQPGVLDDRVLEERELGMRAGLARLLRACDVVAVYTDCGISSGMKHDIGIAIAMGHDIEYRQIAATWDVDQKREGWT